jgi:peptidoglycan/xylan/chitin deacetylase (PgdA/CDA1 family)
MRWIADNCRPIWPEELREAATEGRSARPAVLVTFDDGYLSYRERAYPVLKDLGIPAVVFLATAYIDEPTRLFWWDALRAGILAGTRDRVELPWAAGTVVPLPDRPARERLLRAAKDHLKDAPGEQLEDDVSELLRRLDAHRERHGERVMMTWDDVKATLDITRFGGHTHSHPILSAVSSDRIDAEVANCRDKIASATGSSPRLFAYPNGRSRDFDGRARDALVRHGFTEAFSTEEGVNGAHTDWLAVRRFAGDGPVSDLTWRLLRAG